MVFKARRVIPGMLDFINFFAWSQYNPSYHRDLGNKRDYRVQLSAAFIAFILSIVLIVQGLEESAKRPSLTFTVQNIGDPSEVLDLFESEAAGDGSVTSLTCPCTLTSVPLSTGSDWTLNEDPFCTSIRTATTIPITTLPPEFTELAAAVQSPQDLCIPPEAYGDFASSVELMVRQGNLFDPSSPDFDDSVQVFARDMETSLCSMAFGLGKQANFFPNPIGPISTQFINLCSTLPNEEEYLTPLVFQYSDTDANIIQIQATRTWSLFTASVDTCNTLSRLRESFNRDVQSNTVFQSNVALSPSDYQAAVERVYNDSLTARGGGATPFVPGFIPDITAALTGPPTLFDLPQFDGLKTPTLRQLFSPPSDIPVQTYPLTSRLPFVRTDFIRGGARFFHLFAPGVGGAAATPIFTGEARLVAHTDNPGSFPFLPTDEVTPGFVPGETLDWVPLGPDLLTLMDACYDGIPLSMDIHNLRPVNYLPITSPEFWDPPYNAINLSTTENPYVCSMGDAPPPPPPQGSGVNRAPQSILFSVNITCPPLFNILARYRRSSTYFNASSPVRFTVDEYLRVFGRGGGGGPPTPEQETLLTKYLKGDSGERAALLTQNLMGVASGTNFSHDPLKYYGVCNPKVCSYTIISERTFDVIALDAVGIYGGTASAVIMFLGILVYWISVCGYHIDHLYEPEKYPLRWIDPPAENEGEGGMEEGSPDGVDMIALNPLRGGSARVVSSSESSSKTTITTWT